MFSQKIIHECIFYIMKKLLLLLILLFQFNFTFAQDPPFYNYGIEHGLPSNEVYEIMGDKHGYIWLATESGLCRFNGVHFKIYRPANGEELSITQLFEHPETGIYCRSFDGRLYHAVTDSLEEFRLAKGINDYRIIQNKIRFITPKSICDLSLDGRKVDTLFYLDNDSISIFSIYNDNLINSSGYRLIDSHGKYIRNINNNLWKASKLGDVPVLYSRITGEINEILPDGSMRPYSPMPHAPSFICSPTMMRKLDDDIFYASFCGVYINRSKRHIFKDYVITDIYKDREQNYWLSTLGDGLFLIPFIETREYRRNNSELKTRPDKVILDKNGNCYILGVSNIYMLDKKTGSIKHLHELENRKEVQAAFYIPHNNKMIFESGGFYELDLNNPQAPPRYIGNNNLKSVIKTKAGYLIREWNFFSIMITPGENRDTANYIFNYTNKAYSDYGNYRFYRFDDFARSSKARHSAYSQTSDEYLLSFNDKVVKISEAGYDTISYKGNPILTTSLYSPGDGFLIAARNEGLLYLPGKNAMPELIIPASYYSNKNIVKMEVHRGVLWLLISDRIISIRLNDKKINILGPEDGIDDYEYRDFVLSDSTLWIVSNKSVLEMPREFNIASSAPPLLGNVEIYYRGQLTDTTKAGEFRYKNNDLKINFEGIHYRSRGKFVYKTFLKGYDKEIQNISSEKPTLHYRLLPPGNYELFIYAEEPDGNISNVFRYRFIIKMPFWQQWWFYVLLVAAAGGISYAVGFFYVQNVRKRNEVEKQLIESKLTSLKAQMNPHFIFNALGSIQFLVLNGEIKNANIYLGKFSKLMRMVLDASDLSAVSLSSELEILTLYLELEKLRMGESFSYSIEVKNSMTQDSVLLPPLLLQPYIENAVRHGLLHKQGNKKVTITFEADASHKKLICTINDNGIGREAAEKLRKRSHRSFSSKANLARLSLYHQRYPGYFDISYIDKADDGNGTTVIITLPLDFKG